MNENPYPGPYRGKRNDYRALSEYWAKRSRYFEERFKARAPVKWGHQYVVHIYVEGEPQERKIQELLDALNDGVDKVLGTAQFVGVEIRDVDTRPSSNGD
jgi:hypothetical protein